MDEGWWSASNSIGVTVMIAGQSNIGVGLENSSVIGEFSIAILF